MNQLSLSIGLSLRDRGLDAMEGGWVDGMRALAREISHERGAVSSDDLQELAVQMRTPPDHPNQWGAIFRGKDWRCIGRKRSQIPTNHAREIRVWRWVPCR